MLERKRKEEKKERKKQKEIDKIKQNEREIDEAADRALNRKFEAQDRQNVGVIEVDNPV